MTKAAAIAQNRQSRCCRIAAPRIAFMALLAALLVTSGLASSALAAKERVISLYNIHTRDNITIVYKRGGKFVPSALEKLNWFLRDWRRDVSIKMDPKLFDLLSAIHKELGSERPIHVISGFRSPKTNAMLRKSRGGQARKSYHMLGKAIDVHFPDVSVRQLRYSALVRQLGGVGYYPTSSIPFVHVDTGRVRHWPRMGRQELALLFPRGRSRHIPRDGKPITWADVVRARNARPKLAMKVAAYHNLRTGKTGRPAPWQTRTQVAARTAPKLPTARPIQAPTPRLAAAPVPALQPVPRLVGPPRLRGSDGQRTPALRRLAALSARDTAGSVDRSRLDRLAALALRDRQSSSPLNGSAVGALPPRGIRIPPDALPPSGGGRAAQRTRSAALPADDEPSWIPAPEFDEDHSEEMFYTPFPVSPYLTDTASVDDDALVVMRHPDAAKTLAMLPEAGGQPLVRWVRGKSIGTVRAALRFNGAAVKPAVNLLPPAEPSAADKPRAIAAAQ